MRKTTRESFEMAHHHNLWRSKKDISGGDIISCIAEALREHVFIWSINKCELLEQTSSDLELVVAAISAHEEGTLGLSSRSHVSISLNELFTVAARNINNKINL